MNDDVDSIADGAITLTERPGKGEVVTLLITEGGVYLEVRNLQDETPISEVNRRILAHALVHGPCVVDMNRVRKDLANDGILESIVTRICAGHTLERDGSKMSGKLDEKATEAEQELLELIDREPSRWIDQNWTIRDEYEWVYDFASHAITGQWSDDDIEDWLLEARIDAQQKMVTLDGDAFPALARLRDERRAHIK